MSYDPVIMFPLWAIKAVIGRKCDFKKNIFYPISTPNSSLFSKNRHISLPNISIPAKVYRGRTISLYLIFDLSENCCKMIGASLVVTNNFYATKNALSRLSI